MKIEIIIASLPDRENVVAELWLDNKQIAEVSNENNNLAVEFYTAPIPDQLSLPLDELLEALQDARESLIGDKINQS